MRWTCHYIKATKKEKKEIAEEKIEKELPPKKKKKNCEFLELRTTNNLCLAPII
jgi:hypothetical protein